MQEKRECWNVPKWPVFKKWPGLGTGTLNEYQKSKKKYIKKYNFRKKYSYLLKMLAKKQNESITWKILFSSQKIQKKIFPMPSHQTDVDGFKSDLFLLSYGPLEPMVINFTCDLSLVCILPCWSDQNVIFATQFSENIWEKLGRSPKIFILPGFQKPVSLTHLILLELLIHHLKTTVFRITEKYHPKLLYDARMKLY